MDTLRIVFMGTPDFSVPALEALAMSQHEIVGVFCQPDRAKGRGNKMQVPPVKACALAHNLPVYQPNRLSSHELQKQIEELAPHLIIVIAYGKIIPSWLLDIPPLGCINMHASILPKYRGAAPIQWAILEGETETGITVMQMDEGMDTGDILKTFSLPILPNETAGELFDRLAKLSGEAIVPVVESLLEGELVPQKQDHEKATYTHKITKEMGHINWEKDGETICHQIRGLNPWPSAFTVIKNTRFKIHKANISTNASMSFEAHDNKPNVKSDFPPGAIIAMDRDTFTVQTGKGIVSVLEVQPDNKKKMSGGDFCRGWGVSIGDVLHEDR